MSKDRSCYCSMKATLLHVVSPILTKMINSPLTGQFDLNSVRCIQTGATVLTTDLVSEFNKKVKKCDFVNGRWHNIYKSSFGRNFDDWLIYWITNFKFRLSSYATICWRHLKSSDFDWSHLTSTEVIWRRLKSSDVDWSHLKSSNDVRWCVLTLHHLSVFSYEKNNEIDCHFIYLFMFTLWY